MKKTILLFCFSIILLSFAKCSINRYSHNEKSATQKGFTLKGVIFDGENGDLLPGAIVYLTDTKSSSETVIKDTINSENNTLNCRQLVIPDSLLGSSTDLEGKYKIKNIPVGDYALVARMIDFKPFQKNISVHRDTVINIKLWLSGLSDSAQNVKEF